MQRIFETLMLNFAMNKALIAELDGNAVEQRLGMAYGA
jgi:hypothetical protein